MKAKRQRVRVKRIVLAAVIVSAVLVVSSMAYAVPAPAAGKPSLREVTVLDPFSLRTITVPSASRGEKLGSPPGSADLRLVRPVRVPSRPPCRSAFKPDVDWRPTAG
jgi:hypothetical protein